MIDWFSFVFYPGILIILPVTLKFLLQFNCLICALALGFAVPLFAFYPTIFMIVISLVYKGTTLISKDNDSSRRMKFVRLAAEVWWSIGKIYHGYEIRGLENIPPGGALLVYYHGMVPIDIGYVSSMFVKFRNQVMEGIIDRTLFRIPGAHTMTEVMGGTCKNREYCTQRLKEGVYMSVSPGGAYEMMFSRNYEVEWKNRLGFAKMAKESGKPIVPMFTENIREYTTMITFGLRDWMEAFYEKYRFPICLAFGGFPVKLRTHFGIPLYCEDDESVEEFAKRVKKAIERLRDTHQRRPGSIVAALAERIF